MKVTLRVLSVILLLIVGICAFIYLSPDYDMYFVRSGSMVPAVNVGDLVITGPVGGPLTPSIEPWKIITYERTKDTLVTHRVISITDDGRLITKGDSNEDVDQTPVSLSQVKGIYFMKVPYLGYMTSFIRTKLGWYLSIIIPAMLLVAFIIKDIVKEALTNEN